MVWVLYLVFFIVLGVVLAKTAPGTAKTVLKWINRFKFALLAVLGIVLALYFLSSSSTFFILLGGLAVMLAVWQLMFDNPFGWVRTMLPL